MANDPLQWLLPGAAPMPQPVDPIQDLIRRMTAPEPIVEPTPEQPLSTGAKVAGILADVLRGYTAGRTGQYPGPSVLQDLLARRSQMAQEDTARRQAGASSRAASERARAQAELGIVQATEDRRSKQSIAETEARAKTEAERIKAEAEAQEKLGARLRAVRPVLAYHSDELGQLGVAPEMLGEMDVDQLEAVASRAKRVRDDRLEQSRKRQETEKPDKLQEELDLGAFQRVQALLEDEAGTLEAKLGAATDPNALKTEINRIRSKYAAYTKRIMSPQIARHVVAIVEDEIEPVLQEYERKIEEAEAAEAARAAQPPPPPTGPLLRHTGLGRIVGSMLGGSQTPRQIPPDDPRALRQ